MNCEECYWYHEGKENDCWFEHNPSEKCGDYEPLNNEEYFYKMLHDALTKEDGNGNNNSW